MFLSKNWFNILIKRRVLYFLLKKKNIFNNSIFLKKNIKNRLITKFKFNKIIKKKKFNKNFLESKSFKNIVNEKNKYLFDNKKKYLKNDLFINIKKNIKYCGLVNFKKNTATNYKNYNKTIITNFKLKSKIYNKTELSSINSLIYFF